MRSSIPFDCSRSFVYVLIPFLKSVSHFRLRYSVYRQLLSEARALGAQLDRKRQIALWWNTIWYSLTESILQHTFETSVDFPNTVAPIVVCGFWRSGTTYLHELLACDGAFNYPNTAACFNPALLLLPGAIGRRSSRELYRPMDGMLVSADSPQEDEFALMTLGLRSPYGAMIFPSLLGAAAADLDPGGWSEPDRCHWKSGFMNFLRRLSANDPRRLLLKSPTHSFKIDLLAGMLPGSQFVIILRDPCEVWASNEKMWRSMFKLHAVEKLSDPAVDRFIAQAYCMMVDRLEQALSELPANRYCFTSFESLEIEPIACLQQIYEKLTLPDFNKVRPRFMVRVERSKQFRKSHYVFNASYRDEVLGKIGDAHERLKYLASK